jgi:hypothetical protein
MKKKLRKKQARKKERRREKKEKRKKEEGSGRSRRGLASPDLVGSRRRPTVSPRRISLGLMETHHGFFFFFFSGRGSRSLTSPSSSLCPDTSRRPTSQKVDDRPPRPTARSRRPWVWFFLGFRMIKSQKGSPSPLGFSFDALEMNWWH